MPSYRIVMHRTDGQGVQVGYCGATDLAEAAFMASTHVALDDPEGVLYDEVSVHLQNPQVKTKRRVRDAATE